MSRTLNIDGTRIRTSYRRSFPVKDALVNIVTMVLGVGITVSAFAIATLWWFVLAGLFV